MDPRIDFRDALMLAEMRLDNLRREAAAEASLPRRTESPARALQRRVGHALIGAGQALAGEKWLMARPARTSQRGC